MLVRFKIKRKSTLLRKRNHLFRIPLNGLDPRGAGGIQSGDNGLVQSLFACLALARWYSRALLNQPCSKWAIARQPPSGSATSWSYFPTYFLNPCKLGIHHFELSPYYQTCFNMQKCSSWSQPDPCRSAPLVSSKPVLRSLWFRKGQGIPQLRLACTLCAKRLWKYKLPSNAPLLTLFKRVQKS